MFSECAVSILDWALDGDFGLLGSLSFSLPCCAFRKSSQNHDSVCLCASDFPVTACTPHPIFLPQYLCSVLRGKLIDKDKIDMQWWFQIDFKIKAISAQIGQARLFCQPGGVSHCGIGQFQNDFELSWCWSHSETCVVWFLLVHHSLSSFSLMSQLPWQLLPLRKGGHQRWVQRVPLCSLSRCPLCRPAELAGAHPRHLKKCHNTLSLQANAENRFSLVYNSVCISVECF